jgi:hypothetical protein
MTKENKFMLAMPVLGIMAGFAVTAILMGISVPQFSEYLLTATEKADWERIEWFGSKVFGSGLLVMSSVIVIALIVVLLLFLQILNHHTESVFKRWKSRAGIKFLIVVLISFVWFYLLAGISDTFFVLQWEISRIIQFCIFTVGTAGFWFVVAEQGWAGDYSSWGMSKDSKAARVALLGFGAGAAIFAVVQLFDLSLRKYTILVSAVLGGSGEPSFLGFKQLALGSVLQLGLELSLIAGFVIALAPVQRDAAEIRRRLLKPIIAFVTISGLLLAAYWYAGIKYDLDKPNLARVLGVSDKAKDSRTILVFNPSKVLPVTIQEWPLRVSGWSIAAQSTIELSVENLHKVESYLDAHPEGTIYTYVARNILMNGYYALWNVDRGQEWHVKAAESQLLPRLMLLARFRFMRITSENLKLLESYSDEKVWRHRGRSAQALSMGYQHFGKDTEARAWLQKAEKYGAKITNSNYIDAPIVTSGIISGKIYINGWPLANAQVALLGHSTDREHVDSYQITDTNLSRELQAVVKSDKDGKFTFTSLSSGKYLLALMTEKNIIPFDVQPGKIKVSNVPELIQIGPIEKQDVGVINIITNL